MTKHVIVDGSQKYTRISKAHARKEFASGHNFYIIAHKMRPGFPFSMGMTVDSAAHLKEHSERSISASSIYSGAGYAFDSMVANFCYYNANCHETGTYPAFYLVN